MAARTILFDLDGTLWDSHPWYGAAFQAGSGRPPEETIERLRAGHNIVHLARECGISTSRFNRVCYEVVSELRLYADVPEVLEELDRRGVLMGVVTNLPQRLVQPILTHLGIIGYFHTLIFNARKPSPAGIRRALSELGQGAGADVYYVGDARTDAEAAVTAGISFAWASYGYTSVCPHNTTVVLRNSVDILDL